MAKPFLSSIIPGLLVSSGQSSTLTWSSTNVSSCTASGGRSGTKSTSGSQSVSPAATTVYTLTCAGTGGSISKAVTIAVTPLPLLPGITFRPRLEGRGDLTGLTFTSRIFPSGGATPLAIFTGSGGAIALPVGISLNPGSYDIDISAPYYLRKRHPALSFAIGADFTLNALPAGDLNQDQTINSLDWSIMSPKWFTNDAVADLNKDGIVNSIDFSLMNRNWGEEGG